MPHFAPSTRFGTLVWAGAALLSGACGPKPPRPPEDLNLVLISVDTLRRDRLNCYGYQAREVSPHLDKLAAEGIVFEGAVSSSPWTTPAHLSLLTSLAPSSHGVMTPFFEMLRQVGARQVVESLPESRTTLAEVLSSHGYASAAFTGGVTVDASIGFGQGFALYDSSMGKLSETNMGRLEQWIDDHSHRPFFIFWHTFEVHAPYLSPEFLGEVLAPQPAAEAEATLAEIGRNFPQAIPPAAVAKLSQLARGKPEVSAALYDGCVQSMDRRLGQLVTKLRERGLYEKTMIVFTSDHGEELGDRSAGGLFGSHGHSLFEEMVGIPLVVKLPSSRYAGTRISHVARIVDVMPTVLQELGLAAPPEMEGAPLQPLWQTADAPPRLAFSEALAYAQEKKSVRSGRYKLVLSVSEEALSEHGRRYLPDGLQGAELYDLVADPLERRNLLEGDSVPRDVVARLEASLRAYVAEHRGESARSELPAGADERLRALGYVQ